MPQSIPLDNPFYSGFNDFLRDYVSSHKEQVQKVLNSGKVKRSSLEQVANTGVNPVFVSGAVSSGIGYADTEELDYVWGRDIDVPESGVFDGVRKRLSWVGSKVKSALFPKSLVGRLVKDAGAIALGVYLAIPFIGAVDSINRSKRAFFSSDNEGFVESVETLSTKMSDLGLNFPQGTNLPPLKVYCFYDSITRAKDAHGEFIAPQTIYWKSHPGRENSKDYYSLLHEVLHGFYSTYPEHQKKKFESIVNSYLERVNSLSEGWESLGWQDQMELGTFFPLTSYFGKRGNYSFFDLDEAHSYFGEQYSRYLKRRSAEKSTKYDLFLDHFSEFYSPIFSPQEGDFSFDDNSEIVPINSFKNAPFFDLVAENFRRLNHNLVRHLFFLKKDRNFANNE